MSKHEYQYHRWAWLSYLVVLLLAVIGFCRILSAVGWYTNEGVFDFLTDQAAEEEVVLAMLIQAIGIPRLIETLLLMPFGILFLIWVVRKHCNARGLEATGLHYGPVMCVVWFLIPIFQFFKPYSVVKEIWRASNPQSSILDTEDWMRSRELPHLVSWWWFMTLMVGFVPIFEVLREINPTAFGWLSLTGAKILTDGTVVLWALTTIRMMLTLERRQTQRYRLLRSHSTEKQLVAAQSIGAFATVD